LSALVGGPIMKAKTKARSMLARKLENPEFRKRFEDGYAAFEQ